MKVAHSGKTVTRSLWVPTDKNVPHFRVGQTPLFEIQRSLTVIVHSRVGLNKAWRQEEHQASKTSHQAIPSYLNAALRD